jgi:hypothetical protein
MAFTVAPCLRTLFAEINTIAPGRSKATDGTIGDSAHQQRKSDHNPDQGGVVRAIDVTHDPAGGADMAVIAERLRLRRDPRAKYVIFNRRIASKNTDWVWRKFTGTNPHTKHMHVSVVADARANETTSWGLAHGSTINGSTANGTTPTTPLPMTTTPPEVVPGETSENVLTLQLALIRLGLIGDTPGNHDRHYGDKTQAVVEQFQREHGLHPDRKVGPKTWAALLALAPA